MTYLKKIKQYKSYIFSILLMALVSTAIILSVPFLRYIGRDNFNTTLLDTLDLSDYDKLMIVAHPDDEMLWGGAELLSNNYLVVCITNGNNIRRSTEFKKVIDATQNKGIILSYPDKINGIRSDWSFCKSSIDNDISMIINYKKWDKIVTHNENGEYGHAHHIMTHKIVDDICENNALTNHQYYFGEYHKKSELSKNPSAYTKSLSDELVSAKEDVLSIYESQSKTITKLGHMIPYENIQKRSD